MDHHGHRHTHHHSADAESQDGSFSSYSGSDIESESGSAMSEGESDIDDVMVRAATRVASLPQPSPVTNPVLAEALRYQQNQHEMHSPNRMPDGSIFGDQQPPAHMQHHPGSMQATEQQLGRTRKPGKVVV